MSLHRSDLLSGQWRQDADGRLTPCHFFELEAGSEVAPAALCGAIPHSVREATSLLLSSADYLPSKGDCLACRRRIGEDLGADYGQRADMI
jgi:hypothetical protein